MSLGLAVLALATPTAAAAHTCVVAVEHTGAPVIATAVAETPEDAASRARSQVCAALLSERGLTCDDAQRIRVWQASSRQSVTIQNGETRREATVEMHAATRAVAEGQASAATRPEACQAARKAACSKIGLTCPPDTVRVLAIDGIPTQVLFAPAPTPPR